MKLAHAHADGVKEYTLPAMPPSQTLPAHMLSAVRRITQQEAALAGNERSKVLAGLG